jgi:hypothetical protein
MPWRCISAGGMPSLRDPFNIGSTANEKAYLYKLLHFV